YNQASTSIPSDSFPGLLAMVTGGTPKSTGVFYDAAYDRSLYPPGSACQGPRGTQTVYDETIAKPDAAGHIPFSGGAIDPSQLARDPSRIDGLDSSGHTQVGGPAIFGMKFQAVSVAEKLVDPVKSCVRNTKGGCDPNYVAGGYVKTKTGLAFSPQMVSALAAV